MAREQEIPFVFALGRKALGRCVNKLVPVSVVGIFNYFGAEVRLEDIYSLPTPNPTSRQYIFCWHMPVLFKHLKMMTLQEWKILEYYYISFFSV